MGTTDTGVGEPGGTSSGAARSPSWKVRNLWKLYDAAWASFQRRAGNEFKFAITMWTAVAALIGVTLTYKVHVTEWYFGVLALAGFVTLHCWYERGMTQSNNTDLAKCRDLEDTIVAAIGHKWSDDAQRQITARKNRGWCSKHWSHVVHVGMTAFLGVLAFVFLCCINLDQSTQNQETTASRQAAVSPADTNGPAIAVPQNAAQQQGKVPENVARQSTDAKPMSDGDAGPAPNTQNEE